MGTVSKFIENRLKLKINRKEQKARDRVRELTPRGTSEDIKSTMDVINRWYMGWSNDYQMTQYPSQLASIEAYTRRRLRARIVDQSKNKENPL